MFHMARFLNPEQYIVKTVVPPDQKVDFYFDDQSQKQEMLAGWDLYIRNQPYQIKNLYGATPRFENDEDFLPLQAADLSLVPQQLCGYRQIASALRILLREIAVAIALPRRWIGPDRDESKHPSARGLLDGSYLVFWFVIHRLNLSHADTLVCYSVWGVPRWPSDRAGRREPAQ